MSKLPDVPVNVSQLISYQEGSVVSREILKNDSATVTLFAFSEGQGLSEHKTPFNALVQIIDGEGEITLAGKVNKVKAGELLLMPAGQLHALKAVKPFKMILIMIKVEIK